MVTKPDTDGAKPEARRGDEQDARRRQLEDPLLQGAIARRAYEIYEAAGRPDGQEVAHWLQAEAEILGR